MKIWRWFHCTDLLFYILYTSCILHLYFSILTFKRHWKQLKDTKVIKSIKKNLSSMLLGSIWGYAASLCIDWCTFLVNFLISWFVLTFYSTYFIMYHTSSSRCVKYVLKIFQTKIMKNEETANLKWKELNQNYSWKKAFPFNKRATLLDKRAPG